MNTNLLVTDNWSNMESEDRYLGNWPDEPDVLAMREQGEECRSCSFWAKLNDEWGLCCNAQSRHHLETVFEHFTCPSHIDEGLGPHSFTSDKKGHCVCGGRGTKYMKRFSNIVGSIQAKEDALTIEKPVEWPEGFFDAGEPSQ